MREPTPLHYIATYVALLLLSGLTLLLSLASLGTLGDGLALLIAALKATLVAVFFMHLLLERSVSAIFLSVALILVAFFVALTALDVATRGEATPPGGALVSPAAAPPA
jgi:cytochrome c oxidase subunit 4